MYSINNDWKSVVAERFIKTLKNNISTNPWLKYMKSVHWRIRKYSQ